jgi:hypothetical protein
LPVRPGARPCAVAPRLGARQASVL